MKNLIFLFVALAFACSSEDQDPAPAAKEATQITQTGTGCQAIISKDVHTTGRELKITATFTGCHDDIVFEARNDASSYRQGAACDTTVKTISFAYTGTVLKVGLYVCGGNPAKAGRAYTLTIEDSGVVSTIKTQIGNVNQYTVK